MSNPRKRKRGPLSIATTEPLPHNLRLHPAHPQVTKTLSKLSRPSLLSLASEWCKEENLKTCGPYLSEGEKNEDLEAPYTAAESLDEVRELYEESLPGRKGSKREVIDHILEGDWRRGITLQQLAMAEMRWVLETPNALRWTAMRLDRHDWKADLAESLKDRKRHLPPFQPYTFLLALQRDVGPLAKAHYYLHRPSSHPLTIIRVFLHDTPFNTQTSFNYTQFKNADAPRSVFLAFPTSTPFVYVSLPTSADEGTDPKEAIETSALQRYVVDAIPRALSTPGDRWDLVSTALVARSLDALLAMRGPGRSNNAQGAWSVYAHETDPIEKGPMAIDRPEKVKDDELDGGKEGESARPGVKRPFQHEDPTQHLEERAKKRLKQIAHGRFGWSADKDDGRGLHRFDVRIEDAFPASSAGGLGLDDSNATVEGSEDSSMPNPFNPSVKVSFQGQLRCLWILREHY